MAVAKPEEAAACQHHGARCIGSLRRRSSATGRGDATSPAGTVRELKVVVSGPRLAGVEPNAVDV
jgi:hypothetical protein